MHVHEAIYLKRVNIHPCGGMTDPVNTRNGRICFNPWTFIPGRSSKEKKKSSDFALKQQKVFHVSIINVNNLS